MDLSYKGDVSTRREETPYTGDKKEKQEEEDIFVRRTQKPITRRKESPFLNLQIKDWMKDGIDVSRIPMEHRDIHSNSVYSKMAGSARTLVSPITKYKRTIGKIQKFLIFGRRWWRQQTTPCNQALLQPI